MATFRLRRQTVSTLKRIGADDPPPGSSAVAQAVAARDLQALAAALAAHPQAWKTDLLKIDAEGRSTRVDGPVAHYVIQVNWHQALPVLHAAGDPLTGQHPDSKLTLLQQAARLARPAALQYLLTRPIAHDLDDALACVVGSSNRSSNSLLRSANALVAAGANIWAQSKTGSGPKVLPVIAMRHGHMDLACWLLEQAVAPPSNESTQEDWGEHLRTAWFLQMKEGYHQASEHLRVARVLVAHGQVGSPTEWLKQLDNSNQDRSAIAGYPSHYQATAAAVELFLDENAFDRDEVAQCWPALSGHPVLSQALARYQGQALEATTPVPARPRLPRRL